MSPLLRAVSWLVWRLVPGRGATKMAEFSHTEAGSGLDMLAAVEETTRPELKARYFQHALDELRHSRLFRERAVALTDAHDRARGPRAAAPGRAQAVLDDAGYIAAQGIRGTDSLFQQLGELEFLAFVWVAEKRGAEQFEIYAELLRDDPATTAMFVEIARDERFHIRYSRAELDRYVGAGAGRDVAWAVIRVRGRRAWQAWLRLTRDLGNLVSSAWLGVLYFIVLGPFSVVARRAERRSPGFLPPTPGPPAITRARYLA
ncbi:MAG: ferritin-like domain-containing protein [Pseudomonadota bacterium]|nr:ferritin-like domain-containing protein [Pseudomonadota bacterium]